QAVAHAVCSGLLLSQFIHSGVGKVALAVQFPVVGQHETIAENIVGGGEQAAGGFGETVNAVIERLRQKVNAASGIPQLCCRSQFCTMSMVQAGAVRVTTIAALLEWQRD
ncbi:MAG: hypothetical protein ABSH48_28335, partial [Verrucomicrobiota bacterium]